MPLYIRESDGKPRDARYVRQWINRQDLPEPFTLEDVAEYGWTEYTPPPPTPLTIEQLLVLKRSEINFWRDQEENAGFAALGHNWDSTPQSREKLINAHLGGQGSPTGFWTSADDVDVPNADATFIAALWGAMVTRGAQIHARQREMKAALGALSYEQLKAFTPGWVA